MRILALLFLILLSPALAWAGPLEEGKAALQRLDSTLAIKLLQPLAEQGNAEAQLSLGIMYVYGQGIEKDEIKGIKWLESAAEQGDPEAQKTLNHMTPDAQKDKEGCNPCTKQTLWNEKFNAFEVKLISPWVKDYNIFKVQFDTVANDIQIEFKTVDGKKNSTFKILWIGQKAFATFGLKEKPDYLGDLIDVPFLQLNLLRSILGRALPEGPPAKLGTTKIDYTSEKVGIQFATPGADGYIPWPWHVSGDIKVLSPDLIEYELELTNPMKNNKTYEIKKSLTTFSGNLSYRKNTKINDGMLMKGWKLWGWPEKESQGIKTVADVRKKMDKIEEEAHEREKKRLEEALKNGTIKPKLMTPEKTKP